MTDMRKLPSASVEAKVETEGDAVVVHITNRSKALAFQLAAEAFDESGNFVPMVMWNDNYIELMPDESAVLSAAVPSSYHGQNLKLRLSGWNVARWEQDVSLKLKPAAR